MNKANILKVLESKKDVYHLKNFILFGSVARNTDSINSDIDIAYVEDSNHRLNFDSYLRLEKELSDIFKAKIDLINYKKFNPLIKLKAEKEFIYV